MKKLILLMLLFMVNVCFSSYQPNTLFLVDAMDSLTNWTSPGSTETLDTNIFHNGSGSIRLTTEDDQGQLLTNSSFDFTLKTGFGFWLRVEGLITLERVKVLLYEGADFASFSLYDLDTIPDFRFYPIVEGEWVWIWLPKDGFSTGNGLTWTSSTHVDKIVISINRIDGGSDTAIYIDDLTGDAPTKGGVIMMFDGASSNVPTLGLPALSARGFKAHASAISDLVGTAGYTDLAGLRILYNAGWGIGNHSKSHPDMDLISAKEMRLQLGTCYRYLIDNGFYRGSNILTWPGNTAKPSRAIGTATAGSTGTFTITGVDLTSQYPDGSTFDVYESTGNDAGSPYTVISTAFSTNTTITVATVADGTDDGFMTPWYGRDIAGEYADFTRGFSNGSLVKKALGGEDGGSSWIPTDFNQIPYWAVSQTYPALTRTWADDYETDAQARIDRGEIIVFYMHDIFVTGGSDGIDIDLILLNDMLDWMKAQEDLGNLEVMTPFQYLAGTSGMTEVRVFKPTDSGYRARYNFEEIFKKTE